MLDWLGLSAEHRAEHWSQWCGEFLTAAGDVRALGGFVNKKITDVHPQLTQVFFAEGERVQDVIDSCRALAMANISSALMTLAAPVLRGYAEYKQASGWVDYGDLIARTSDLLRDLGAAWVLYKLDGGLDHLLLDEVQDTAPAQWDIEHALTAEFFAGIGARDAQRTVFAVGDRKQSIYAFQGADVDSFNTA